MLGGIIAPTTIELAITGTAFLAMSSRSRPQPSAQPTSQSSTMRQLRSKRPLQRYLAVRLWLLSTCIKPFI